MAIMLAGSQPEPDVAIVRADRRVTSSNIPAQGHRDGGRGCGHSLLQDDRTKTPIVRRCPNPGVLDREPSGKTVEVYPQPTAARQPDVLAAQRDCPLASESRSCSIGNS